MGCCGCILLFWGGEWLCLQLKMHQRDGMAVRSLSASRSCPDPGNLRAAARKKTQMNNSCYSGDARASDGCRIWLGSFSDTFVVRYRRVTPAWPYWWGYSDWCRWRIWTSEAQDTSQNEINLEEEKHGYQAERKHGVEQRFERKLRVDISVVGGWGWSCCSAESPWGENWIGKGVRSGRKSTGNPTTCCRSENVGKTWSSLRSVFVCSGCWSRMGPVMNLHLPAVCGTGLSNSLSCSPFASEFCSIY